MERLIDINTYMWGPKSKQGKKDLDIQGIHTHAAQGMEEELGNKDRKRKGVALRELIDFLIIDKS